MAVDLGGVAMRTEDEIGREADQAVPPARRAAFDRFEQEVAAARLDELKRGGDRRFGVGDLPPPDERRAPGGEGRDRRGAGAHLSCRRR